MDQWPWTQAARTAGGAARWSAEVISWIELRSNGDGFVVDTPRIWSVALAGARYRSIEAADTGSSSSRIAGLYRSSPWTTSPRASSPSSWIRIEAARYFPHCPPEAAHTRRSTF